MNVTAELNQTETKSRLKNFLAFFKKAFRKSQEDDIRYLAAGLSYYTIFSLVPLFVLLVFIFSFFLGENATSGAILMSLREVVGPQIGGFLADTLQQANNRLENIFTGILSLGVLIWASSSLLFHLEHSMRVVFGMADLEEEGIRKMVKKRIRSLFYLSLMTVLLFFVLTLTLLLPIIIGVVQDLMPLVPDIVVFVGQSIISVLIMAGFVTALYRLFTRDRVRWKSAFTASLLVSFLFVVANALLGIYLTYGANVNIYGTAGSIVAVLFWLYWTYKILLFGAEIVSLREGEIAS